MAFISPYSKDRDFAKKIHQDAGIPFYECYISASLEVCEGRDVKGLYKKARAGEIKNFTGVSDPYEAPTNADMDIKTGELSLDECVNQVIKQLTDDGLLKDNNVTEIAQPLYESISSEEQTAVDSLKVIDIEVEQVEYLQTIGQGWAFPLNKFMDEMQVLEVTQMKTLTHNHKQHLFSVPITQHVSADEMATLKDEKRIAIKCTKISQDVLAVIEEPVFFDNRKEEISARTFGTLSTKHPKVDRIMSQGDYLVSGKSMKFIKEIKFNDGMDSYRMTPNQISEEIKKRNADVVYAFQVRNPLHNGHVLLLKDTREQLLK